MSLPDNVLRISNRETDLDKDPREPAELRKEIEPWLSAVFQSEHLSLLIGNGLTTAIAARAEGGAIDMTAPKFDVAHSEVVAKRAEQLADGAGRGSPNIEDSVASAEALRSRCS